MQTTKVFKSGNSQAVRLPKEFQIHSETVEIFRRNGDIIIREIPKTLEKAFNLLTHFPEDFFAEGRKDPSPQDRDF
ncbi:MAG: AbrB/MazE/SpoVT family DNA-binding domain-containing protein [Proteobacteria bacterium]|nr:AbrB/MazE/SpoVT family DNA-binding domain-containing protein [Pseudomonadota bacterium]